MKLRRVVVTGLGALTPIGNNVPEFWNNLVNGVSGAGPITHFDASKFKTQIACELKNVDIDGLLGAKVVRRLDPVIVYALIASDEAIKDARLAEIENKDRIGVLWASGIGGINTLQEEIVTFIHGDGTPRFNPLLVPKMIVDGSAGNIAIRHGFKGVTGAIVTACASSTHCISMAYDQIRLGRADVIVAGGSEAAISFVGVGAFNALKALSTRNDDPTRASRPYDKNRDGFVLGEGAGALVLEDYEHAVKRGATIYAEIIGSAANCDAYHITAPEPTGSGAQKVIELALENANIKPEDIDYINPHSTSTELGDVAEINAITKAFGDAVFNVNISATKSMTGHLVSATGAVESVACIMAINHGIVPPTINLEELDPEIDARLNLTPNVAKHTPINTAICINFGFGGHNSAAIFRKLKD